MSQISRDNRKASRQSVLWFVALWVLGVAGAALLALPFHLLVAAALHR
ncbi:hypothetical protein NE850_13820 [Paraburkholderia sp. USG1]|nr:hypothetical protein [Paraburkholderia sp. USG1]MDR8397419.1 hypothetical protein [Paraburkholderia sp. USG1]